MQLRKKTILITGGTSGIGYALAQELLKRDNTIILLGRNECMLTEAQAKGFKTIKCDLQKQQDIENAAMYIQQNHPVLDVLFNNAGIQENYHFTESVIPLEKIRREIEINLSSQVILTHLLLPQLSASNEALIVNSTSALGAYPKNDGLVYSVSKAGLRNFTVGLRDTVKGLPIEIIEFIPPVTDTHMTASRNETKMSPIQLVQTVIPQLEKGRTIATIPSVRIFLWIAFLFPRLASKILSKS
jgi:uncharacterized oxidoreductase